MFQLLAAAVLASTIPTYDVGRICRSDVELAQDESNFDSCINDERAAKEHIAREWATYPPSAKRQCLSNTNEDLDQSYVELMTCFQIEDWMKHLNAVGGATGGTEGGGSPPSPTQMGGYSATHPLGGRPTIHVP